MHEGKTASRSVIDPSISRRDTAAIAETTAIGLGGPSYIGGQPPRVRFFFVRCMVTSMGGPCGRVSALPVPMYRSANLYGLPTPSWRMGRRMTTAYIGATMQKNHNAAGGGNLAAAALDLRNGGQQ